MAAAPSFPRLSLREYLATAYHQDREYVNRVLIKRRSSGERISMITHVFESDNLSRKELTNLADNLPLNTASLYAQLR